ncbi:DNA polymerase IV [Desulfuromonas acetoxidans]|uniref:DNA polymerase IV n=1 Tax=Desulfuromonas acetoxidans TaxID=891 RepID=UPI002930925C|nr:DNA polymerase IV [Desulfuromonas acetoxidans]
MEPQRKIIHIDMDAFYASVEQRDHPELRGKPVIVGGPPDSRGVVATCSYEARKFGIHSAMASSRAYRLCPQALFVRPRMEVYRQVSSQIRAIFEHYTDLIEPLSLDEAFLDLTMSDRQPNSATWIAREILERIHRETELTASAGVSYNKFLAKVASDCHKPAGLTVITPDQASDFIAQLPIRRFFGVGKVTEKKMLRLGITCGADLLKYPETELIRLFGKQGRFFYRIARGIDERPVVAHRQRKSIGNETTLSEDIRNRDQMLTILSALAEKIEGRLAHYQTSAYTITLKIKFSDFQQVTLSFTNDQPLKSADDMMAIATTLLQDSAAGERAVRLLGLTLSNLVSGHTSDPCGQLPLPFPGHSSTIAPSNHIEQPHKVYS